MKVAIIGAMEEEVTILRDKLEDLKQATIAGSEFNMGTLNGVDVIVVKIRYWESKCSDVYNDFIRKIQAGCSH